MLRTTAISLILLLSVGVMLPFANSAHGVRQSANVGVRRHHRYHSRAWWRRYRARMRKRRAAAALAHRNALLGLPKNIPIGEVSAASIPVLPPLPSSAAVISDVKPIANSSEVKPMVISSEVKPVVTNSDVKLAVNNSELKPVVKSSEKPMVKTAAAKLPGQMNLSVVALSRPNPVFLTSREESRMLGGLAVADLRRIVIDKMVVAGGWVINDFIREVNGARVFVVTAHTPKDARSPEKAWTFYFTEAGGRIYGLTTDSPVEFADRMSTEAERFIISLRAKSE
jgi:hypothetical protein